MAWAKLALIAGFAFLSFNSAAQEDTTAVYNLSYEDSLSIFDDMDSLSIFRLIDSVLSATQKSSTLNVRLSYTSRVTSAGRDFSVKQYGFTPGVSFYHHSGGFADVSGYWNSQFEPNYSLTVLSVGYLGLPTKWLSYNIAFERSFYAQAASDSIITAPPNGFNGTLFFDADWLYATIDYTYLFGNGDAHRLSGALSGNIVFRKVWFLDKITLFPSANFLFGNEELVSYRFNVDLTDPRIQRLIRRFPRLRRRVLTPDTRDVFGLMNVSFSTPISLRYKQFSLLLSYTYNIPVELPGESLADTRPNSYFSTSLGYMIPLRQKK
ncbi:MULTISPECIES: hypothetical protein [unclassified Imperialibacter]|uniref:hypothetical protein n=1 Tax=unclassified Imperialibacter TaxID=2629706 RepID=UPI00125FEDF9|nr:MULTISPECIES: hypothetical protein [unclassified Imperialibacter]